MEVSNILSDFLNFMKDAVTNYNIACAEMADTNNATQDLLHRIELCEDSPDDTTRLAYALKEVRKHRRKAKDNIAILELVFVWCGNNKRVIKSLEHLLGDVRKAESTLGRRLYHEKTDIVSLVLNKNENQ